MTDFRKQFYAELKNRNDGQRRAIETIEGPVMVIAGPGTGKTDVLGLRIGNILEKTQIAIQNILCLTYTEAGAMEMRKRLLQYIGPTAYNGQIYTFHGFCNMVIHENLDRFGVYREAQPASELEQFQILREILDEEPIDSPLKRHTGMIYYEAKRLKDLFETMKLEHWSPQFMLESIDDWTISQRENSDYIYLRPSKRKGVVYAKGDLKDWKFRNEVEEPMDLLAAAVAAFDKYNTKLRAMGRYDYHDMLTWVHDAFDEDDDLLARYQERYQYFLVDEFQDTNGIQLAILNQLASHWERPDIFAVGDDDQSIFRFQGASMHNITAFKKTYDPEVIVLTDNYRSSQQILDAAGILIANNFERLVALYPEYEKNLVAKSGREPLLPEIRAYPNETQEKAALLHELMALNDSGMLDKEEVAVIYRRHSQVEDLVHAMEVSRIPLNVKKPVNILHRPVIRNILTIMRYLAGEFHEIHSGERFLFEMLHYRFFGITSRDAGTVAYACRSTKDRWRNVMSSTKILSHYDVKDPAPVVALHEQLSSWQENMAHLTIQELLEQIMTKGGVLKWIFAHPNRSWNLQLLKTFFDHVQQESMRNPELTLRQFLENIDLMADNNIDLPVYKTLSVKNGVHFVTAHSAKGMQFDRVYVMGCTKRVWDEAGYSWSSSYKMPGILQRSTDTSEQDERRLFYVAMTRAKQHLVMSYAMFDDAERELEPSRFVQEVIDGMQIKPYQAELTEDQHAEYCRELMRPLEVELPLIDHDLINQTLESFEMSVSALNTYLECPRKFYFESILSIPSARKSYFGFGSAIHDALQLFFFWKVEKKEVHGTAQDLVDFYVRSLKKYKSHFTEVEYKGHEHMGSQILETYFEQRVKDWVLPLHFKTEHRIRNVQHNGVPIKGFIDRIDIYKDHLVVYDYKTGRASNLFSKHKGPSEKDPQGGNYWRQIVFYKILLDADEEFRQPMDHGWIDFVQPRSSGEHEKYKIQVTPEDVEFVSEQMTEAYRDIMDHKFDRGCELDTCYWCNLVRNEMVVDRQAELPVEEFEV